MNIQAGLDGADVFMLVPCNGEYVRVTMDAEGALALGGALVDLAAMAKGMTEMSGVVQ